MTELPSNPHDHQVAASDGRVYQYEGGAWAVLESGFLAVADVQTFDTPGSATWIKPSDGLVVLVEVWGAGGGGSGSSDFANGSGGGGGAYDRRWLPLADLSNTSYTVGAGGAGGSYTQFNNSAGGNGGTSAFGTLVTAPGGDGASSFAVGAGAQLVPATNSPWNGQNGQGTTGGRSAPAYASGDSTSYGQGGAGGQDGSSPGGGGGGGLTSNQSDGGDGAPGRVRVTVFGRSVKA